MDITLKLEGSAHGGVGVCNADCETPCVHIPIVGEVCSPIPCVNKTLSKTLIAPLGVTIDHTGVSVDQPKFF